MYLHLSTIINIMSRVTAPVAKVIKGTTSTLTGSPSLLVAQAVHTRRLAENTRSQSLQTDKSAVVSYDIPSDRLGID